MPTQLSDIESFAAHGLDGIAENRFEDLTAPSGSIDYRLRQLDLDGSYSYSPIVTIQRNEIIGFEISSLYPQPVQNEMIIRFTLPHASNASLELFDMLGRPIQTLFTHMLDAGSHTFHLTGIHLPPGRYQLQLTSDGVLRSAPVIIW